MRGLWIGRGLSNYASRADHVGMGSDEIRIDDYPGRAVDKVRYGDTDRQGHVNNAVFATFFETGRVELLHLGQHPVAEDGCSFVIAHLGVDFRAELLWPGEVVIGTRVTKVGSSSVRLAQALFQDDRCTATAETVIVQVDETTKKSRELSTAAVEYLTGLVQSDDG
jgi:acyl-CoA thioester hydrolase